MIARTEALVVMIAAAYFATGAVAGNIDRPAGAIPAPETRDSSQLAPRHQTAKSVLIPLRRKMSLAVAEVPESKKKEAIPLPAATPTAKKSEEAPAAVKKSEVKVVSEPPSVTDDASSDLDPWDSAVRRFDQQDPSKAVSKGIRVEDIIEPTADYQYSASRRKNPFVPDLVLGQYVKQKELSPNDVEIPIISPLQSVAVASLAVIGVWEGDDHVLKALIETPTNQGIEAKLGDPAGNSGGRIMSITPDSVIVREFFLRPDGTREYSDKPIKMGGDRPPTTTDVPGERWVLRPGASTPELDKGQPTGAIISTPPPSVPSGIPGTMSSLVPQIPEGSSAPVMMDKAKFESTVVPVQVQGGQ